MKQISRKDFIKAVGISAAALSLPISGGCREKVMDKTKPQIGIQLYTVRNEIEKDFEASISKLAEIGYKGVETYFFPENISLEYAGDILRKYNLEVLGSHCELPVDDNREIILKMADAYKTDRMIYHGWPQDDKYKGLDAIKNTVEVYNEVNNFANSNGLKFGLHNHWWEFQEYESITPFYYLLENLDPNIFFEIDVYWTKTAGLDPAKVIKDFGKRAPLIHIKDGPAPAGTPVHKQNILGKGTVNLSEIAQAGADTIDWMIVEFDEYDGNIFNAVEESYNFLKTNKFAV